MCASRSSIRQQHETLCCFLTYIKQTFCEVNVLFATLVILPVNLEVSSSDGTNPRVKCLCLGGECLEMLLQQTKQFPRRCYFCIWVFNTAPQARATNNLAFAGHEPRPRAATAYSDLPPCSACSLTFLPLQQEAITRPHNVLHTSLQ